MTEDEMVGWHHLFSGHELGQTPGDNEGQRGLVCCTPWGCNKMDMTEQLNSNNVMLTHVKLTHDVCVVK